MPNTSLRDPNHNVSAFSRKPPHESFRLAAGMIVYPRSPLYHGIMSPLLCIIEFANPCAARLPRLTALFLFMRSFLLAASDPYPGQMSYPDLRSPTETEYVSALRERNDFPPKVSFHLICRHNRCCVIYVNIYKQSAVAAACNLRHYTIPLLDLLICDDLA